MDVPVVTLLSCVDFYNMISMPMVSATASYYTLMSFELVQPMKNTSFLLEILAVKRFTMIQGFRFVPYTFSGKKMPQVVPTDLNIGFQGLAAGPWHSKEALSSHVAPVEQMLRQWSREAVVAGLHSHTVTWQEGW